MRRQVLLGEAIRRLGAAIQQIGLGAADDAHQALIGALLAIQAALALPNRRLDEPALPLRAQWLAARAAATIRRAQRHLDARLRAEAMRLLREAARSLQDAQGV